MQVVINIDEEIYEVLKNDEWLKTGKTFVAKTLAIADAVANGAVLPKGHGRLIDADALNKDLEKWWIDTTHEPKTIISVYEDVLRNIRMADIIIERETN